jgi:hypothetical protein
MLLCSLSNSRMFTFTLNKKSPTAQQVYSSTLPVILTLALKTNRGYNSKLGAVHPVHWSGRGARRARANLAGAAAHQAVADAPGSRRAGRYHGRRDGIHDGGGRGRAGGRPTGYRAARGLHRLRPVAAGTASGAARNDSEEVEMRKRRTTALWQKLSDGDVQYLGLRRCSSRFSIKTS